MQIAINQLKELNQKIIQPSDYKESEQAFLSEIFLYMQLSGNFSSFIDYIETCFNKDPKARPVQSLKDTPLSAWLEGNYTNSLLVMQSAMETLRLKVKDYGLAIVAASYKDPLFGSIGYCVEQIAKEGYIAFACSSEYENLVSIGNIGAFLGESFAIALPTSNHPLVLDRKSSISKEEMSHILNLFGEKSDNLALALKLLMQSLLRALLGEESIEEKEPKEEKEAKKQKQGILMLAFDSELFIGREKFKIEMDHFVNTLKADSVFAEFDKLYALTQQSLKQGWIEVDDGLYERLQKSL